MNCESEADKTRKDSSSRGSWNKRKFCGIWPEQDKTAFQHFDYWSSALNSSTDIKIFKDTQVVQTHKLDKIA